MRVTSALGLVLTAVVASHAVSAFDRDAYRGASLAATHAEECAKSKEGYSIDTRFPKLRATVTYQGRVKPISTRSRDFILAWAKAFSLSQEVPALYKREINVR